MAKKWTKDELDLLKKLAPKMGIREVAKTMNRTYYSVDKKARIIGLGFNQKNNINRIDQSKLFIEKNKNLIYDLKEQLKIVTPLKETKNNYIREGDSLIVHFADWHIGKVVKDEEGKELYNVEVFKTRINVLLQEILRLLDAYIRKGTPIKEVVIISTGDILDGMGIYSTQEIQSELSPPFQVMLGVEVIQKFILSILKRKLSITFYGVKGNHGEIRGERGKQKDPNANWDLQLYLILDFWVRNNLKTKKVKVHYSELDYLNFEVQGWKYHIRHIAPQQSETSAGKAKFLGWARKHNCDALVYGHYHHWNIGDRSGVTVFKGGSIVGVDELAEKMAEESEPIQLIWGVSKHRPLTFSYPVDLGERKKK